MGAYPANKPASEATATAPAATTTVNTAWRGGLNTVGIAFLLFLILILLVLGFGFFC